MNDRVPRKDAIISLLSLPLVAGVGRCGDDWRRVGAVARPQGCRVCREVDDQRQDVLELRSVPSSLTSARRSRAFIAPAGYCNIYAPAAKH